MTLIRFHTFEWVRMLRHDLVEQPRVRLADNCMSLHYSDVIMTTIASQITSLTIVYSTVYSGADQSKHQSSASLAFVWGIHRGPVNSPHKWPVMRKMFPFDDVIMLRLCGTLTSMQIIGNTLRSVVAYMQQRIGSSLVRITAWRPSAPSHYLNQCWLCKSKNTFKMSSAKRRLLCPSFKCQEQTNTTKLEPVHLRIV